MIIRPATASDFPNISAIHQASFTGGWSEESITETALSPNSYNFIAESENQAVGFIIIKIASDEIEIITICTSPEYQRQGIARELLQEAIKHSKQSKAKSIYLEVSENNIAAINLYLSSEFQKTGMRKNYYDEDGNKSNAILMKLDL